MKKILLLISAFHPPLKTRPATRRLTALGAQIRAIAPPGMSELANQCVLEGLTFEKARERLLAEHTKHCAPAGTPPPAEAAKATAAPKIADIPDGELVRALT